MIICFECSQATKDLLDRLISSGQYRDYSDVIALSLSNQALLHSELKSKRATVFDQATPPAPAKSRRPPLRERFVVGPSGQRVLDVSRSFATIIDDYGIPDLFSPVPARTTGPVAQSPNDSFSTNKKVPLSHWIFGLHNKLLPLKASCRAIAHLVGKERGIELTSVSSTIAQEANKLGLHLRMLDRRFDRKRDESLSLGFPTKDDFGKATVRFANQFVASANKDGKLSGLLAELKLINWLSSREKQISLTQAGWEFALMPNPALDSKDTESNTDRFSPQERNFLLEHIAKNTLNERFAYLSLLSMINEGNDTPDKLRKALGSLEDGKSKFSPSFFATQRSGALSRMVDLSLVLRRWKGIFVKYEITEAGKKFLNRHSKSMARLK